MLAKLRIILTLCALIVIGYALTTAPAVAVGALVVKLLMTLAEPISNFAEAPFVAALATLMLIIVLPVITIIILLPLGLILFLITWGFMGMPLTELKTQLKQAGSDKLKDKDEPEGTDKPEDPTTNPEEVGKGCLRLIAIAIIIVLCILILAYISL